MHRDFKVLGSGHKTVQKFDYNLEVFATIGQYQWEQLNQNQRLLNQSKHRCPDNSLTQNSKQEKTNSADLEMVTLVGPSSKHLWVEIVNPLKWELAAATTNIIKPRYYPSREKAVEHRSLPSLPSFSIYFEIIHINRIKLINGLRKQFSHFSKNHIHIPDDDCGANNNIGRPIHPLVAEWSEM